MWNHRIEFDILENKDNMCDVKTVTSRPKDSSKLQGESR